MKKIPLRSEVAVEDTWNLSDLYATDEDWKKDVAALKAKLPEISLFKAA